MEYKWEKDVLTESVMPMRKMMMVCSIFLLLVSCNRVDARAEIYVEAFENVISMPTKRSPMPTNSSLMPAKSSTMPTISCLMENPKAMSFQFNCEPLCMG